MINIGFYIINIIIAVFTLFLIFIYIKSDLFKSIAFYFNIFFCFVITLDNALRLIPVKDTNISDPTNWCKAQAFLLSFLDKLFITSITIYSIINYTIMILPKLYEEKMKLIYCSLIAINICISLVLTIIFYLNGLSNTSFEHRFCYIKTNDSTKKLIDTIYTFILLLIDIFCLIRILIKINSLIKQWNIHRNESKKKLYGHFWRFLIDLFLNIITFGYLLLLINKKLPFGQAIIKDLIYILLGLGAELFFTINSVFFKEAMRIITCNKCERFRRVDERIESLTSDEIDSINEEENRDTIY